MYWVERKRVVRGEGTGNEGDGVTGEVRWGGWGGVESIVSVSESTVISRMSQHYDKQ